MQTLESTMHTDSAREEGAALARKLMHDEEYLAYVANIMKPIDEFYGIVDERTNNEVALYKSRIRTQLIVLMAMVLATLVVMFVSYFVIRMKVSDPLRLIYKEALTGFNNKINIDSSDEIGVLANAINRISEDIKIKTAFVKAIGDGDLSQTLPVTSEEDKLGTSLLKMREDLTKIREEDTRRTWTNEGLARFGEILQQNTDMQSVCDKLLSNLVRYVNANQGGLFLVEQQKDK